MELLEGFTKQSLIDLLDDPDKLDEFIDDVAWEKDPDWWRVIIKNELVDTHGMRRKDVEAI